MTTRAWVSVIFIVMLFEFVDANGGCGERAYPDGDTCSQCYEEWQCKQSWDWNDRENNPLCTASEEVRDYEKNGGSANCICAKGSWPGWHAGYGRLFCNPCPANTYQSDVLDIALIDRNEDKPAWKEFLYGPNLVYANDPDWRCLPCPDGCTSAQVSGYCTCVDGSIYPAPPAAPSTARGYQLSTHDGDFILRA